MEEQTLKDLVAALTAGMSVIVAGWAIAAAFRSGVLRRITFGPLEIEAGQREAIRGGVEEALRSRGPTPFEIEQRPTTIHRY